MYSSVNTIWVLLGAALVFLMQAGFAMCEAGFTRAKNTGNILMKNLMDFCIGTPVYWLLGFGLMFASGGALIGGLDPMVQGDYSAILPEGVPLFAYLIFQTVFCATSATIVSGAMAERTKFLSYCIYSFCISAFIYPISGHWIWGGGWLSDLGFHDFAGSTAVHMVGGICACIGAAILGPRLGKYDKDGKPRAILGHSLSLGALGVFILWFCWFGFNGASTVSMTGDNTLVSAGLIFVNTNMSAAVACCVTMLYTWLRYKKPDVGMTMNAALAGLVAVTAGCDAVSIISDEVVSLQNQLEELQTENVTLTAQHEQMFDLATVKEVAEAAGMSKPSSSQIYYIDLSEGDSAVVYQQEESNLLSRLLTSLNHGIYAVVEYFE